MGNWWPTGRTRPAVSFNMTSRMLFFSIWAEKHLASGGWTIFDSEAITVITQGFAGSHCSAVWYRIQSCSSRLPFTSANYCYLNELKLLWRCVKKKEKSWPQKLQVTIKMGKSFFFFTEFMRKPMCYRPNLWRISVWNTTTHKETSARCTGATRAAGVSDLKGKELRFEM